MCHAVIFNMYIFYLCIGYLYWFTNEFIPYYHRYFSVSFPKILNAGYFNILAYKLFLMPYSHQPVSNIKREIPQYVLKMLLQSDCKELCGVRYIIKVKKSLK